MPLPGTVLEHHWGASLCHAHWGATSSSTSHLRSPCASPTRAPPLAPPRQVQVAACSTPHPVLCQPPASAGVLLMMPLRRAGPRELRWLRRGCELLAHLASLGITGFLLLLSRPGTSLFSWHPLFMSIAFCLGMTEAILIFSPDSSLFCCCSQRVKDQLYLTAQTLLLVAATLGLAFIVSSKNRSELPHFVSWHSVLGLLTFLATCGQVLCGLCLQFPQLLRILPVSQLRPCHAMCGLMVYLLATFTVVLAMYSDWFQAQIKGVAWYFCFGLPFCPAAVITTQIISTHLPKKRLCV